MRGPILPCVTDGHFGAGSWFNGSLVIDTKIADLTGQRICGVDKVDQRFIGAKGKRHIYGHVSHFGRSCAFGAPIQEACLETVIGLPVFHLPAAPDRDLAVVRGLEKPGGIEVDRPKFFGKEDLGGGRRRLAGVTVIGGYGQELLVGYCLCQGKMAPDVIRICAGRQTERDEGEYKRFQLSDAQVGSMGWTITASHLLVQCEFALVAGHAFLALVRGFHPPYIAFSNVCRSATSTSSIVTGSPRSTSEVTP